MRDMVACFSDHAVRVAETTCSSYANLHYLPQKPPSISQNTTPALQTSVTSIYKITLTTKKQFLVTVTWFRTHVGHQGLAISFDDDPLSAAAFKLSTAAARIFKEKKGTRSVDLNGSKVDLFWDLSEVNYGFSGAEPIDGYYLIIMVDGEIGLTLGNLCREVVSKKVKLGASMAEFSSVSRREYYDGNTLYCTKAKFSETGAVHEISIRCGGESSKQPVMAVSVDRRTVVKVKRLQWNFRGNQTVFIDGLLVDLMWDVHGWFYGGGHGGGLAVFMFRRRNGVESRLWLQEEKEGLKKKEDEEKTTTEFSLMICASKSP